MFVPPRRARYIRPISIARAHVLIALGLVAACGGSPATTTVATAHEVRPANGAQVAVEAEPIEFAVSGKRVGSAVLLEIVGVGRGVIEGQAFEDPETWDIRCSVDGRELQRVVNGSARVERAPVGPARHNRWDITVEYSVGFALPADVATVNVAVSAPGAIRFAGPVSLELARR